MFSHMENFSNLVRRENDSRNRLEVEIISTDHIKPAAPTPNHLRRYELSILDQTSPFVYTPFVYFYPNNNQNDSKVIDLDDLTLSRKQILKGSLSETLTRFSPLAGKVKDYRHIDCNDDGVCCVDAKASQSLSDFLSQPGNKSVESLLPSEANAMILHSNTHVLMIQLTTFTCGGISIGLCASHKIFDGSSYATFLKAWAATAAGKETPSQFISPSVFPSKPAMPEILQLHFATKFGKQGKSTTKRFVFCASSLAKLKKKGGASRVLAINALIWKCTIKVLRDPMTPNNQKSVGYSTTVNLRGRSSPPIPSHTMGNIFTTRCAVSQCSEDAGLESLVRRLKNCIDEVDVDFVEALKGENGSHRMLEVMKEMGMVNADKSIVSTSLCNCGMYEVDFGWGKPIWVSFITAGENADPNIPVLTNFIILMDTRSGNGIEACVTLPDQDMAILERDPELLEMALVDPSPLDL